MRMLRRMCALLICLAMLAGIAGACAQGVNWKWSLGDVRIRVLDEEFLLEPRLILQALQREDALAVHFEVDSGDDVLLPVTAEFAKDAIYLSLGSGGRIYGLDMETIAEFLDLGSRGEAFFAELAVLLPLLTKIEQPMSDPAWIAGHDEALNRMYEVLVGSAAQPREVEVEGKTLNGRVYSGEIRVVHLLDLAEYLRNCGIPEFSDPANSLLRLFNISENRNYLSFSSHFYDGVFGNFDLNESFGTLEMILAWDDETVYTKETISQGENNVTTTEAIHRAGGSVITGESMVKEEINDYSCRETVRMETEGPYLSPDRIAMLMETESSYTVQQPAAARSVTEKNHSTAELEFVREGERLRGSMEIQDHYCSGYDSGEGPVEITEDMAFTGSYTETENAAGGVDGNIEAVMMLDGEEILDFGCVMQYGEEAQIEPLNSGEAQVRALTADTGDLAYTLLQADLLSFAAEGAVLTTSEGLYDLIRFFSDEAEDVDWPKALGDDVRSVYTQYFNEPWKTVYSYADAKKIFVGGVPRFTAPEGSVLSSIMTGEHNMLISYLNNDSDFQIDITCMGTASDATSPTAQAGPGDYTYIEEDGLVTSAYFYNGEVLVLVTFEKADRARAEAILSGLKLNSSAGRLAA